MSIELSRACKLLRRDIQAQRSQTGDFGCTPLYWAAVKDDLCSVEILLDMGADVNILDLIKRTTLLYKHRLPKQHV